MINPYQSPAAATNAHSPVRYSVPRVLFFLLNFTVAVFLFISCVIVVAVPTTPFSFLGGIVGFCPILAYGICEWLAFYRRRVSIERKLGYANLGCAAFVGFGVVTNIGEALMADAPPGFLFFFWFLLIACAIIAYLVASGLCRLRWTRRRDLGSGRQ